MLRGRLLAESLRVGHDLQVRALTVTRVGRHDVSKATLPNGDAVGSAGATESQPSIWTFIDFQAPDDRADELAVAIADALVAENGWWADFVVGDEHVVVFADKIFRYRIGDTEARRQAVEYGLAVGTPPHQLDWGE